MQKNQNRNNKINDNTVKVLKLSENKEFLINILNNYKQEKIKIKSYLQNINKSIRITQKIIQEID